MLNSGSFLVRSLQRGWYRGHVWFAVVAGLLAVHGSAVQAGETLTAAEVLNKATAAARKLVAISYEATVTADGALAEKYPTFTGKIIAIRGSNEQNHKLCIRGNSVAPGTRQTSTFHLATNGTDAAYTDSSTKTYTFGRPAESGLQLNNPLFPPRFLNDAPYKDVLEGKDAKYEGLKTIDGKEYHLVSVVLPNMASQPSRFYFGKEDFLLRRLEMAYRMTPVVGTNANNATIIFNMTNLAFPDKVDEKIFSLECPTGYEKKPLAPAPPPGRPGLLPVGSEAPDWELKDQDGKAVSLKGLRGKVVLLDFWATWCGPCKMAMPSLQKLHERFKDKPVLVLGVNCWEKTDPMAYIKQRGFTYGQLLKGDSVAVTYKVSGIPCLYLIGRDGKILYADSGFSPQLEDMLGQMIERALKS